MSLRCWPSKTPQISSLIRWDWCGLPDTEFLILLNFQNDQKQEWGRVDAVVMDRWCNWPLVVWAFRVILLLSSLWFIWNNYICQIPASYTSMASNTRNWPITPGLLYVFEGGTGCRMQWQCGVQPLISLNSCPGAEFPCKYLLRRWVTASESPPGPGQGRAGDRLQTRGL